VTDLERRLEALAEAYRSSPNHNLVVLFDEAVGSAAPAMRDIADAIIDGGIEMARVLQPTAAMLDHIIAQGAER
jgi:hypothetical protein